MLRLRLFRRRDRDTRQAPSLPAVDRSALLRELEVDVPAPERLVRWDTALDQRRIRT